MIRGLCAFRAAICCCEEVRGAECRSGGRSKTKNGDFKSLLCMIWQQHAVIDC